MSARQRMIVLGGIVILAIIGFFIAGATGAYQGPQGPTTPSIPGKTVEETPKATETPTSEELGDGLTETEREELSDGFAYEVTNVLHDALVEQVGEDTVNKMFIGVSNNENPSSTGETTKATNVNVQNVPKTVDALKALTVLQNWFEANPTDYEWDVEVNADEEVTQSGLIAILYAHETSAEATNNLAVQIAFLPTRNAEHPDTLDIEMLVEVY